MDVLNPLQHIPIVGSVYRSVTGDEISGPAKIMGGLLYGGPIGFIAALVTTIAEQETGQDLGQAAVAALFGGEETSDVLLAERAADALAAPVGILDRLPAGPAAISASLPAGAPVTTGAGPQAALSGPAALHAFKQDIRGAGQASPLGGINGAAGIEVVPLPPLAPPAPNPQLAVNVKIGAIEPGPLGWTIQRSAESTATALGPSPRAALTDPLAADLLAEAAQISEQAFSERMLQALDKYQAMSRVKDAGQPAAELDIQL